MNQQDTAEQLLAAATHACQDCRLQTARSLTALTLGITLATAVADATGDRSFLAHARLQANNHQWLEAYEVTISRYRRLRRAARKDPGAIPDRTRRIARHAMFAAANLGMAADCLAGCFNATPEDPSYTAEEHLRNCVTMALTSACRALGNDPATAGAALAEIGGRCTHHQQRTVAEAGDTQARAESSARDHRPTDWRAWPAAWTAA